MSKEEVAKEFFVTLDEMMESQEIIERLTIEAITTKPTKIWLYKEIAKTPYNDLLKMHMAATISAAIEHFRNVKF